MPQEPACARLQAGFFCSHLCRIRGSVHRRRARSPRSISAMRGAGLPRLGPRRALLAGGAGPPARRAKSGGRLRRAGPRKLREPPPWPARPVLIGRRLKSSAARFSSLRSRLPATHRRMDPLAPSRRRERAGLEGVVEGRVRTLRPRPRLSSGRGAGHGRSLVVDCRLEDRRGQIRRWAAIARRNFVRSLPGN